MADARFEDGEAGALRLIARDAEDVSIISSLCQDAVLRRGDVKFDRKKRRVAILLNRFRWEDSAAQARRPERVRSLLICEGVLELKSHGIDLTDPEQILSILALEWRADADGAGELHLILAGDGAIAAKLEALEVTLLDVSRPYYAVSGKTPAHKV